MCARKYGECSKISYTQVSDKIAFANSADLKEQSDQSTLFAIPLSISRNDYVKSNI